MILFWVAAALLTAALAAAVLLRAVRTRAQAADPEEAVHRRRLAELDDLKSRGLLDEDGWRAARAEAGRRLIAAREAKPESPREVDAGDRKILFGVLAVLPVVASAVYLAVGSPGYPDQPFTARVAQWRAADPATLDAARLAAVMADLAKERPNDPQVWSWLGTARAANADLLGAAEAFRRAVELRPGFAGDWESFGVVLVELNRGRVGEDASRAFREALRLDPTTLGARYYLGREAVQSGRLEEGLSIWQALAANLEPGDPRRAALEQEIAAARSPAAAPSLDDPDTAARVRGMVEGLAARLESDPDDPQGWARLIRSYRVLGDETRRAQALARARSLFADKPQDLAVVEDAARFEAPQ